MREERMLGLITTSKLYVLAHACLASAHYSLEEALEAISFVEGKEDKKLH